MYLVGVILSWISAILLLIYRRDPLSAGAYAVLWPFGILLFPWLIYRHFRKRLKSAWIRHAEAIVFLVLLLNAPGALYFHTFAPEIQFDRFQHFTGGFLTLSFLVLWVLAITNSAARTRSLLIILILSAVILQVAWEGFQFSSDRVIGSEMFYDGKQDIARDVAEDIGLGVIGVLLAIPYAYHVLRTPQRYLQTA
jgi:hypothetical protein